MECVMVSVAVITYDHENYIEKALESVFSQRTDFRFEVVVGEDCSPDNTRNILRRFKDICGDQIVLLFRDTNLGPSKNIYDVLLHCKGKYVAFLEGDNYWTDDLKLQKQVVFLENNPRFVAVGHNVFLVDNKGENAKPQLLESQVNKEYSLKDYLRDGFSFDLNSVMIRNIFHLSDNKYMTLYHKSYTMTDIITLCLLYDKGPIYVSGEIMGAHRGVSDRDTSSYSFAQRNRMIEYSYMHIDIIRSLEDFFEHKYDLSPLIANRTAGLLMHRILGGAGLSVVKLDRTQLREYMRSLPIRVRLLSYFKTARKLLRIVQRRFLKKQKKHVST